MVKNFRGRSLAGPVKHLGIRAAGACLSGGTPPVVALGTLGDALFGDAQLKPKIVGLLVEGGIGITSKNCDGKARKRNAKPLGAGEELKAEFNCLLFEVVAERPVAEHLEKGEVDGIADLLDIARAYALLKIDKAFAERVFLPKEERHKGVHAGSRKKDCRVVIRHQRSTLDDRMPLADKEFDIFFTQFACLHLKLASPCIFKGSKQLE